MQFVSAFEEVLDPIVAVLDALPEHFTPELAPVDILELTSAWLGVKPSEKQSTAHVREFVAHAAELGRVRGTHAGIELTLKLSFPDLPLRVEDAGGLAWSADSTPPTVPPPSFVVYCDQPIPRELAAAVVRVIDSVKPVHVPYRLRIKEPHADREAAT